MGAAIRFNIEQAGQPIGQLLNGAVLRRSLSPGQHVFAVRAPSIDGLDSVTINAQAGQTYYVRGQVLVGWPAGRPKFTLVSPAQGQNEVASMPR